MNNRPLPATIGLFTIVGVTSVQVVATMAVVMPASVAPAIAETLDFPVSLIGLQVSLAYVGATVMSLFAGLVTRRFGAVRTNQIAAFVIMISLLVISLAEIAALACGSLGIGVAYGLTNPSAAHLMMKVASEKNRNLIFSIKQTGQPLGGVLAGLMAPSIAVAFGWQSSLVAGAGLAFCAMLAIQPLRRHLDNDRDPDTRFRGQVFDDIAMLMRERELRLLALSALTFSGAQLALMAFAVTMLVEDLKIDIVTAGLALACLQVAGVLGRLGWGALADRMRIGIKILIASQCLTIVFALATSTLVPGSSIVAVFLILFGYGATAVGWNGVFMAEIAGLAPQGRVSNVTGGVLVPTFIGVILGPLVFTSIHAATESYTASFGVLSGVTLLGLLPLLTILRRRRAGASG